MLESHSLIKRLIGFAESTPDKEAIVSVDMCISYAQLLTLVQLQAEVLSQKGIAQGDVLGLECSHEVQHLLLCLAAVYIGATSVTLSTDERAQVIAGLDRYVDNVHLVKSSIPLDSWTKQAGANTCPIEPASSANILFSTSGTTGDPKWVVHSDKGLVEQAHRHIGSSQERFVCLASIEQNFAKRHRLYCVAMGATNIFMSANKPVLEQVYLFTANVMHISAFQAQELLSVIGSQQLTSLRLKLGGSHVPLSLRQALRRRVSNTLQAGYGTTETGAIAFTDPEDNDAGESVGRALPGIEVHAVDSHRNQLPPGTKGELAVRGAGMFLHYLGKPELTRQRLSEAWFYTGDIGYLDANNRIHLCGRVDDMFLFNSMNIYPQDIESVILGHPSVEDVVVVAKPSKIHGNIPVALIVCGDQSRFDRNVLQQFARSHLGQRCPRQFVVVAELPRNSAGKLLRKEACKWLVQHDNVREVLISSLQDAQVVSGDYDPRIEAFLNESSDIHLHELVMDSHARMDLLVSLELYYDCIVTPEQLLQFKTLGEIASYVVTCLKYDHYVDLKDSIDIPLSIDQTGLHADATIVKTVFRALRYSKNATQLNKLLFALESRLTPQNVDRLLASTAVQQSVLQGKPAKFIDIIHRRLERIKSMMLKSGKPHSEAFIRRKVSPAINHYAAATTNQKTLLICFSLKGGRNNMAMPLAVFLQHIDATRYDVLMVSDLVNDGYWSGIPFMGKSITASVKSIAELPLIKKYTSITTMGCSAGSHLALITAYYLNADMGIVLGGRFHKERYLMKIFYKLWASWFAIKTGRCTNVLFVYSKDISRDRIYAKVIGYLSKGCLISVGVNNEKVTHNILDNLIEHGDLSSFLEQTVFTYNKDFITPKTVTALMFSGDKGV